MTSTAAYLAMSNAPDDRRMERLLAKTTLDAGSGCWVWHGSKTVAGYGKMRGGPGVVLYVHRVSWELHRGEIPEGLEIDHLCVNRACVNPWHMEPVTHAVNTARIKLRRTHCPDGHPYSGPNLRIGSTGGRQCRACDHKHNAARWARTKAARTHLRPLADVIDTPLEIEPPKD